MDRELLLAKLRRSSLRDLLVDGQAIRESMLAMASKLASDDYVRKVAYSVIDNPIKSGAIGHNAFTVGNQPRQEEEAHLNDTAKHVH